jgi:hypothetical protein
MKEDGVGLGCDWSWIVRQIVINDYEYVHLTTRSFPSYFASSVWRLVCALRLMEV